MHRLAGRRIFSLDGREFIWEHVVLAAYVWEELPAVERRVGQALATLRRLEDRGEAPTDEEVEEAATRWRYEHDLLSADDLDSWLAVRELGLDEWLGAIARTLVETPARPARALRAAPAPDEIEAAVFADAMCDGTIGALIERLAGRAAIFDRVTSEGGRRGGATKAKLRAAVERLPRTVRRDGLFGMSAADSVRGAELVATMDAAYERFTKSLSGSKTIAREIESHALEWTHVSCETLTFDAEGPAREAALLIREDGLPMANVAEVARAEVVSSGLVLEDVGSALKAQLVAAQPGDLLGPVRDGDGFAVTLITARVAPSVDDRATIDRAWDAIVRRTVGAEVEERIRWHERF